MSHCSAARASRRQEECRDLYAKKVLIFGCDMAQNLPVHCTNVRSILPTQFSYQQLGGLAISRPLNGWSNIIVPGAPRI